MLHDDWDGWSKWKAAGYIVYIDHGWFTQMGSSCDVENAIRWGWGPLENYNPFDETRCIFNDLDYSIEEIESEKAKGSDILVDDYIGKPTLRFHAKEDTKNDHGGDPHYNSSYFDEQLRAIALLSAVDD